MCYDFYVISFGVWKNTNTYFTPEQIKTDKGLFFDQFHYFECNNRFVT